MLDENKICEEIKQLTPEIIREWKEEIKSEVFLVRRLIYFYCPLREELVSEKECHNCPHNYGMASVREIYCAPNGNKGAWRAEGAKKRKA